ncbi:MAG: DUF1192 domain-containing protein [Methylobacteriaceae bacterium]|nr:DUF1192 domain-containing protein [Methylobacteriaceae bacterium]
MRDDLDDRPKPKPVHVVGSDLSALSLHEIDERIATLEAEIERLRAEARRKESSREAASAFFRS